MARISGQIVNLDGVLLQIVQFELRPVQEGIEGSTAKAAVHAACQRRLPGRRAPQIRGRGKLQWPGEIPDQLVAPRPNDAHRVVHRHFVKRV